MIPGAKTGSNACLHANCYLLLTRQTPARSRFACKYAGLAVFAGLREFRSTIISKNSKKAGVNYIWTKPASKKN